MVQDFKQRFIISTVITIPILVLSPLIQQFLGITLVFTGSDFLLWGLSSFIFFYGGWPFLKGIVDELKKKQPGMMTLIALAIFVAYGYSSAVVFGLEGKYFFWELATLIDVMLLGHWIEMKSVMGASRTLEKLAKLLPDTAHLMKNGDTKDVKIFEIQKGDTILVKAGEKIPADGTIKKGSNYLDESMLTGESKPVQKKEGNQVIGGSINGDHVLQIEVEETGENTYLNKVINLVENAQKSKSKTQRFADKAAKWLTFIALSAGGITLIIWLFVGPDFAFAIERMATVMVITCPHALGLAIPLVSAVSTSLSAKNGLLIRNRTAFENSRNISVILFDKTGTLTEGTFGVSSIQSFNEKDSEEDILAIAASIENKSQHPIAKGIVDKAKELEIKLLQVSDFSVMKGKGVEGTLKGKAYQLVSQQYLDENNIDTPEDAIDDIGTQVYIISDDKAVGMMLFSDKIREDSYEAVKKLQEAGIKCMMLTGDNKKIAKAVSEKLNLDGYFAEVLPDKKQEKVKEMQKRGEFVAMTGDGINDSPALAQADVGIAIGSGTDIAAETADIILVNSNPKDVTSLILFGKATFKKMLQNLFWATGYNAVAIPLAAGVLYGYGILISPAVGAALMSLSTVIVAINARLLKVEKR